MHERVRLDVALLLGAGLMLLSLLVPTFSYAVGTAADAQCIGTAQCPVGTGPGKDGPCGDPGGGTIGKNCFDTSNGFTTPGTCTSTIPPKCQASSAPGLNGGNSLSTLSQLGQVLGQVLGKLMQSSSGSGASADEPLATTGCTTGYIYTSDPTQIGVNPCALYQPSSASQLPAGTTGTTGNTSAQDLLNALTGSTGSGTTVGSPAGSLSATPQTGPAPLAVTFTTNSIPMGTYSIDFGDGSTFGAPTSNGCTSTTPTTCQYQISHTYASAGTYTAILSDSNGVTVSTLSISVLNPNGSTSGLSQVLGNVANFLAGSSSPQGPTQTSSSFPGVFGNILLDQNGATIFASTINSANNSETSGFFGSDTLNGQSSQGFAGQLCENRPWAGNFLANIIPPSFFDGLCQWGGYQVGQPAQPQVTLVQQTPSTPPAPKQKPVATTTATIATSTVPAQVQIWAVPSAVPLGARTSVFWNTQGAASCTETSPDGNFSQNSLAGAASTVPITGATTFTISCLDMGGNPVTDYVTVTISS